jgi:hypothetical protein
MRPIQQEWKTAMHHRIACISLVALGWLLFTGAPRARAQEDTEQKGIDKGNYNVKQSIEFGGRLTSISGDTQAYDTFVNLQQGARLLGFTTEMNSLNHHSSLFDRLYFSNFGYGGDPNQVSRLRIAKNTWYKFDALFRKDQNFWDYSIQANPLNPTTPFAPGPAGFGGTACTACVLTTSPHTMNTRRKMGDYNLTIRPDSPVRFRMGYSRNIIEGPAFTTIHQGTEQFLLEDVKTTVNTYRLGVDIKVLPRTNISYDQIWNYYKGDTGMTDFAQPFPVSPTQNVDLGVSFNAGAKQPCPGTFLASGFVNPTCSAYFSYLDHARTRTKTPTEQLNIQSSYWRNLDLSARVSYSSGDASVAGYDQTLFGRESRTNLRNQSTTGPVSGRRVAASADFGATWHITDKLSFQDSFHYSNWHNPMEFDASSCSFFSPNLLTNANSFTPGSPVPLTCVPPANVAPGTVAHNSSSAPDLSIIINSNFLKQDEKSNLSQLDYRFSEKLGARVGFRYRHRFLADNFVDAENEVFYPGPTAALAARGACALVDPNQPLNQANLPTGCTLNGDGSITFIGGSGFAPASAIVPPINEYSGLFGLWAKPLPHWDIRFDMELMSADGSFTRVSPTHSQEYRVRTKYNATSWLNLNGNILIWESRNNEFQQGDLQHNRAYGVSAILQPNEKFGMEIGFDYNDVFSQVLICYISVVAGSPGPGIQACPNVPGLAQQLSTYTNKSSYGFFDFSFTPVHRFTARLGANLTGTSGSELRLDPQALIPNSVTGPLNSKWLHPYGGFEYKFSREWTGKAYWDYYGYHEDPTFGTGGEAAQDVFAPRNFRGNLVTLSLRYAF